MIHYVKTSNKGLILVSFPCDTKSDIYKIFWLLSQRKIHWECGVQHSGLLLKHHQRWRRQWKRKAISSTDMTCIIAHCSVDRWHHVIHASVFILLATMSHSCFYSDSWQALQAPDWCLLWSIQSNIFVRWLKSCWEDCKEKNLPFLLWNYCISPNKRAGCGDRKRTLTLVLFGWNYLKFMC